MKRHSGDEIATLAGGIDHQRGVGIAVVDGIPVIAQIADDLIAAYENRRYHSKLVLPRLDGFIGSSPGDERVLQERCCQFEFTQARNLDLGLLLGIDGDHFLGNILEVIDEIKLT